MHYLYAWKKDAAPRLVATFDTEPQLLSYVRWATLKELGVQSGKYEQGSTLAGYSAWEKSAAPLTDEDASSVVHNPSPNML
jgi:hypothetical protein